MLGLDSECMLKHKFEAKQHATVGLRLQFVASLCYGGLWKMKAENKEHEGLERN